MKPKRKISQHERHRRQSVSEQAKLSKRCSNLPLYFHMVGNMVASGCKVGKAKKLARKMFGVSK